MIKTTYTKMMEVYNNFDRMILSIEVACHSSDIPDTNPLWHWLRFDVVSSLKSCQPMLLHLMDEHDYQKYYEFEISEVLPILEKIIGAWKRIPKNMIGTPEWFLMKKVADKVLVTYVRIKGH